MMPGPALMAEADKVQVATPNGWLCIALTNHNGNGCLQLSLLSNAGVQRFTANCCLCLEIRP